MNAPVNFQQRLGEELAARAATLPAVPPAPAQARPLRVGRYAVTSLGLAAAVTAVIVAVHPGHGPGTSGSVPGTSTVAGGNSVSGITTVGYTVTVRPDHKVALKIIGTKLSGLQTALRDAGLPAVVLTPSAGCGHKVVPADSGHLQAVMSLDPKDGRVALLDPGAVPPGDTLLVVDESPAGAKHKSVGSLAVLLTKQAPACFPTSQVDIGEG